MPCKSHGWRFGDRLEPAACAGRSSWHDLLALKLDVKAEELSTRLDERIAAHLAKVDAYAAQLQRLGDIGSDPQDDDVMSELRGSGSPRRSLERKHQEHRERAALLKFVRDHLVAGEVYRLDNSDLRFAELLPDRYGW